MSSSPATTGSEQNFPESMAGPPAAPKVTDDVDRIIAAWRRECPELDTAPLEVLSRMHRITRHLDKARNRALSRHGLEGWGFDVLTVLRRSGEPYELTPSRLVSETMVSSGTMTNRIDRLEARGLVERRPDPGDRRGTLVRMTHEGRLVVDETLAQLLASERELLSVLSLSQRQDLADLLRPLMNQFPAN